MCDPAHPLLGHSVVLRILLAFGMEGGGVGCQAAQNPLDVVRITRSPLSGIGLRMARRAGADRFKKTTITAPRNRHPWDTPQEPQWVTPLRYRLNYADSGVVRLDCFANRDIIQLRLNYSKEGSLVINGIDQPPTDLSSLGEQMKALAEPKRLRILHMLMEGVQCNCELGDALDMAPNLISHHLRVLREAGLVDVDRDPDDARWVYYSLNRAALEALTQSIGLFFDPSRIKPRRQTCGPQAAVVSVDSVLVSAR